MYPKRYLFVILFLFAFVSIFLSDTRWNKKLFPKGWIAIAESIILDQ